MKRAFTFLLLITMITACTPQFGAIQAVESPTATPVPVKPTATLTPTPLPPQPTNTAVPTLPAEVTAAPKEALPDNMISVPANCVREGRPLYVNLQEGYCFAFPQVFVVNNTSPSLVSTSSLAISGNIESLFVTFGIESSDPAGNTLEALAQSRIQEFGSIPFQVNTRQSSFGGENALILEPVPGRLSSREAMLIHNSRLFRLTFWPYYENPPSDSDNDEVKAARRLFDETYGLVFDSFSFFDTAQEKIVIPRSCVVDGSPLYIDETHTFCFAFPQRFYVTENQDRQYVIYGLTLDKSQDPLRAGLQVLREDVADGQTLAQVVDAFVGRFNGAAITRAPVTIAGDPAEHLVGVPGGSGSQDIFTMHGATAYHFIFTPDVQYLSQAKPDVDALLALVSSSFGYLP